MGRKTACILGVIALVAGFLTLLMAQTKTSDKLKNSKKEVETEIANTQKLLSQTRKNKDAQLQQITILRQQISNREGLISMLNTEIFSLEEELNLNLKLSQEMDKKLEYMKSDYAHVVYMAYKNRKMTDKLTFLFSSESFSQMFLRVKYYTMFARDVKHQVEMIYKTQEEIAQKNSQIVQLKIEKSNLLSGKELEVQQLEQDRNERTKQTNLLKQKEIELTSSLQAKQKKRKELDAAIKKAIQSEIAATNAKKAKNATNATKKTSPSSTTSGSVSANNTVIALTPEEQIISNSFVNNKGKLPWPVIKGTKVSDFGNYPHPDVPSVIIENKGIDILVEEGTVVQSIFQGEVTAIMDIMGTKVLMVRHGEYISVYQNLTSINVKKGDKVTTKQKVGVVAKTSSNNTFELHFEVWKNNAYLNPNQWLTAK